MGARFVNVIGILCVLMILFTSSFWTLPVMSAGNSASDSKISSSLSVRIKIKTRYLAQAGNMPQGQVALPGADIQASGDLTHLNNEKVFLRFSQRPTVAQLSDLNALGVTTYPDSWVPPVGKHNTGFILADMPVDKLDALAAKNYILQLDTAEEMLKPQNDLAGGAMNVADVWSGGGTGAGVTVAVLDSGIDTSNPDFPTLNTSNSKDYSNYPTLDDIITNTVTGHGTHVAGSVLGRGVNSATYKGVAPSANLVFLKIGDDIDGSASRAAVVGAMLAAIDTYHAKIITMSYGGWSTYHDGSGAESQVVDYAVSRGATVFIAAGNNGDDGWHYSGTAAGGNTTADIPVTVASGISSYLSINMVWYDGIGTHNGLNLQYYNSSHTPLSPETSGQSESSRGTESNQYWLSSAVSSGTYYLRVQNSSSSSQSFHIYYLGGATAVTFSSPDPLYTLTSPAEADSAIAVGAYVTRTSWTDYQGHPGTGTTQTVGTIGTFSSRGPRVDGAAPGKPNLVAPGYRIISVRDNNVYPWPAYNTHADIYPYNNYVIDNDGQNLNGSGPASYFVMQGTSMASPLAAGVGALLLSKNSALTPAQVKNALESTATDKGTAGFDNIYGYGLINASAAINSITPIKLVFTTAAQTITAGSASNVITIQTQDATNNNPFNITGAITINLTSTSGTGRFDTSASGPFNGTLTSITIASGSNYTSFYYKDTTTGTPTITAASTGLTSGTQQETVNPAPTSVPAISRWGVVGMIIALAGCIIWMLRRRTARSEI